MGIWHINDDTQNGSDCSSDDYLLVNTFMINGLPYTVKTHYVQISNIIDTSNKCQISGQSTTTVNMLKVVWAYVSYDTYCF